MKKLFKISFLFAVLCFAVPAFADDGDMPTGTKTCTQKCAGLYDDSSTTTDSGDQKPDESTIGEIYTWLYEQISELTD